MLIIGKKNVSIIDNLYSTERAKRQLQTHKRTQADMASPQHLNSPFYRKWDSPKGGGDGFEDRGHWIVVAIGER